MKKVYYYICDRRRKCGQASFCGTVCRHTKDINNAKNKEHHWFEPVMSFGEYQLWERER